MEFTSHTNDCSADLPVYCRDAHPAVLRTVDDFPARMMLGKPTQARVWSGLNGADCHLLCDVRDAISAPRPPAEPWEDDTAPEESGVVACWMCGEQRVPLAAGIKDGEGFAKLTDLGWRCAPAEESVCAQRAKRWWGTG